VSKWTNISQFMALCIGLLVGPTAHAEAEGDTTETVDLEPLVVVASRLPQPQSGVAAQVTVIGSDAIRRSLTEDFDGLLKYEPGLELQTAGTRFSASSVNIRGIGGNRVDIRVDGVPLRNQFIIGAYSNGGRLLVEPDRVKQVEVLHGPASVMHGSNALGGVVAIQTLDPADLLAGTANQASLSLRGGYQGMNRSWVGSGMAAWGNDTHGLLAAVTLRDGHELDNRAPADLPNDPQDWDSQDLMIRYTWEGDSRSRLRLSADQTQRDVTTQIRSLLGYGRRFRSTTDLRGDDHDESRRLSAEYEYTGKAGLFAVLRAYGGRHETDQQTLEERALASQPVEIERRFRYSQDQSGLEGYAFRDLERGATRHRLGAGAEWSTSRIRELRDGLQTSLTDGSVSNVLLGETMPVRDFPVSDTDTVGLWLQDEVSLADGRWTLTPAVRWDRYDLKPRPDDIWREDNPDTPVVTASEQRVTPRLAALWRVADQWSVYGQYSEGFRAPPFEDANIGFDIPLFGFRAIPNPDLRSETSQGLEMGVRGRTERHRFSLAIFRTDYDDFIESRALIGRDPETGDLLFQSRNLDRARISGADLRYELDLSTFGPGGQDWRLQIAAFWTEGENRGTGAPLNSIAPPQAVVGLNWTSPDGNWDVTGTAVFTAAKDEDDIDRSGGERFATPSWTTFDLSAGWRPAGGLEIRAGLFNLANERYWRWLDVANLEADDPMIALLSRPGRSISATARISF
jgi:hemoglobin/transferrin/lactoferrin receptor protein